MFLTADVDVFFLLIGILIFFIILVVTIMVSVNYAVMGFPKPGANNRPTKRNSSHQKYFEESSTPLNPEHQMPLTNQELQLRWEKGSDAVAILPSNGTGTATTTPNVTPNDLRSTSADKEMESQKLADLSISGNFKLFAPPSVTKMFSGIVGEKPAIASKIAGKLLNRSKHK